MTRFFERYAALCDEKNMTVNGAAKEIGLPSSSVTNWKQGRTPRLDKVEKIAEYFGVSADYLLGYTDEKEKPVSARAELDKLIDGMGRDELIDFIAKATEKLREQK